MSNDLDCSTSSSINFNVFLSRFVGWPLIHVSIHWAIPETSRKGDCTGISFVPLCLKLLSHLLRYTIFPLSIHFLILWISKIVSTFIKFPWITSGHDFGVLWRASWSFSYKVHLWLQKHFNDDRFSKIVRSIEKQKSKIMMSKRRGRVDKWPQSNLG